MKTAFLIFTPVLSPSALYGLGFLHAVDRPTQMLFGHAVASGRSTELIADKPELLEADRFFRRAGLFRTCESGVQQLDDVTFGNVTAYCEGVNDGMKQSAAHCRCGRPVFKCTPGINRRCY